MAYGQSDILLPVLRLIIERTRSEEEEEFNAWCEELVALPANLELKPRDGKADIELDPLRWMDSGLDLIQSARVLAHVQLPGGLQGPAFQSYLPYPVFHMGAEIFLKGMWLCQHDECRIITNTSYVDPAIRHKYQQEVGPNGLGHDLIKIITELGHIQQYRNDLVTMRFLKMVEGVIRWYYFPLYKADKPKARWAYSRYPKRFYNDNAHTARADSLSHYPHQAMVAKLFKAAKDRVDQLWNLRNTLGSKKHSTHFKSQRREKAP